MNRKITTQLKKSDKEDGKRLIIITGMKCVGKTYAVLDYVKSEYEEYLYIDAVHDENFKEYIKENAGCGIKELLSGFFKIEEEYLVNIPIILDEPDKSFLEGDAFKDYDGRLKLFVITSDKDNAEALFSRLTIGYIDVSNNCKEISESLQNYAKTSDLGSNIQVVRLSPMNFGDFLVATGKEWYDEVITGHLMSRRKLPEMIHEELLDLYDLYLQIGGMPEIVDEYIRMNGTENIRERQKLIKNALWMHLYENSVDSEVKTKGILDAVEKILEKDNHKFMYSAIRDGVTRKQYEPTVKYLESSGAIFSIPKLPNTAIRTSETIKVSENTKVPTTTDNDFRLYYSDFSLYDRPCGMKLIESAVLQNLLSAQVPVSYWESGTGAELSCVVKAEMGYIPVDINVNGKGKGRSISAYQKQTGTQRTIRLTEENCKFEGNTINIPIYAAYGLKLVL